MTSTIETEDVVALQPCPFCGSADIETISSRLWNDDPDRPERFWVECLSCGAEPYQPSEDQAEIIAAWNARAATPIERLREENARVTGALLTRIREESYCNLVKGCEQERSPECLCQREFDTAVARAALNQQ